MSYSIAKGKTSILVGDDDVLMIRHAGVFVKLAAKSFIELKYNKEERCIEVEYLRHGEVYQLSINLSEDEDEQTVQDFTEALFEALDYIAKKRSATADVTTVETKVSSEASVKKEEPVKKPRLEIKKVSNVNVKQNGSQQPVKKKETENWKLYVVLGTGMLVFLVAVYNFLIR